MCLELLSFFGGILFGVTYLRTCYTGQVLQGLSIHLTLVISERTVVAGPEHYNQGIALQQSESIRHDPVRAVDIAAVNRKDIFEIIETYSGHAL